MEEELKSNPVETSEEETEEDLIQKKDKEINDLKEQLKICRGE